MLCSNVRQTFDGSTNVVTKVVVVVVRVVVAVVVARPQTNLKHLMIVFRTTYQNERNTKKIFAKRIFETKFTFYNFYLFPRQSFESKLLKL